MSGDHFESLTAGNIHEVQNIIVSVHQTQDWQALLFPASLEPSSPRTQLLANDPSFEPRNPYRGLHAFNTENASDFFGRERLIAELLKSFHAVLDVPRKGDTTRLLSVVGPSGSGKSSAVLTGLLPALKRGELPESEHWIYLEPIVPGQHPLEELARTLSYQFPQRSLASLHEDLAEPTARGLHLLFEALVRDKSTTLFLNIDQFEEVFTQTLEVEECTQFLNLLLTALTEPFIGIRLPEFEALLPDGFIGDHDPSLCQKLFDITKAE